MSINELGLNYLYLADSNNLILECSLSHWFQFLYINSQYDSLAWSRRRGRRSRRRATILYCHRK